MWSTWVTLGFGVYIQECVSLHGIWSIHTGVCLFSLCFSELSLSWLQEVWKLQLQLHVSKLPRAPGMSLVQEVVEKGAQRGEIQILLTQGLETWSQIWHNLQDPAWSARSSSLGRSCWAMQFLKDEGPILRDSDIKISPSEPETMALASGFSGNTQRNSQGESQPWGDCVRTGCPPLQGQSLPFLSRHHPPRARTSFLWNPQKTKYLPAHFFTDNQNFYPSKKILPLQFTGVCIQVT